MLTCGGHVPQPDMVSIARDDGVVLYMEEFMGKSEPGLDIGVMDCGKEQLAR